MDKMDKISTNNEQRLYIIHCGKGFSCLGFEVCKNRSERLAKELGEPLKDCSVGSIEAYQEYERLIDVVSQRNQKTGFRSDTELVHQLIGCEGWKVKVVDCYGETRTFIVGKSTGYIPCHLELETKKSKGEEQVSGLPFKSVEKLY